MVDADGIFVGNGDVLQALGVDHHIRQVAGDIRIDLPLLHDALDARLGAQGHHRGHEHAVDLLLKGAQGIAQGDAQGHGHQHQPRGRDNGQKLPKQRQGAAFFTVQW